MRKSRKNQTSGAPGGPKTDAGKARSSLNALKHGRFSRHGSLLKYECDRTFRDIYRGFLSAWAPANPIEASLLESAYDRQDNAYSGLTLRTLDVYRKLPSKPPQLIQSKRNHFDSNPNSNPERTPFGPHSNYATEKTLPCAAVRGALREGRPYRDNSAGQFGRAWVQ